MKEAAKLMATVFAVVFGAGSALIVLMYLFLGGYYLYGRIERANRTSIQIIDSDRSAGAFIKTYDPKSIPKDIFVPDAALDCNYMRGDTLCAVLIGGRLVAFISRDKIK